MVFAHPHFQTVCRYVVKAGALPMQAHVEMCCNLCADSLGTLYCATRPSVQPSIVFHRNLSTAWTAIVCTCVTWCTAWHL